MTRKKRRLYMLLLAMLGLGTATALVLTAFRDNLVFFYSPSDLQTRPVAERSFRLGGLVENGSVKKQDDGITTAFMVTDMKSSVPVVYKGLLPDLFREGQGVVAEGKLGTDGIFVPARCWPSTMRITCRRKWPMRWSAPAPIRSTSPSR